MLKIFYSNRIEHLYQDLKQNLFSNSAPFTHRMIIVPTPAIKSWLLLQFANDENLGIAAGLEIIYLDESLKKLLILSIKNKIAHIPSQMELILAIEGVIRKLVFSKDPLWKPLCDYLKISNGLELSKRSEKRLVSLSETLANLFIEYGKYGPAMIESWKNQESDWQQALWNHVFKEHNWSYPSKNYSYVDPYNLPSDSQIHLFSLSFLPQSEFMLFEKISKNLPVHYYSLSPCSLFWSDSLTKRETFNLQKKGLLFDPQLENFIQDRNPLLSNWGKLGRKMAELFENREHEIFSHYTLPEDLFHEEIYQDYKDEILTWEQTNRSARLLDYLQADLLFMRQPQDEQKELMDDSSVQLHCAPSKQREVQIIYHQLLQLIHQENNLEPAEIIVMAPDIMDYAPYIRLTFGSDDSQLDYQVMDMHLLSEDSLIKQFWHMVNLPFGRWNAKDLMTLFSFPGFQEHHQISAVEVDQMYTWIEESGIRWGENASHRQEILYDRYEENIQDNSEIGTWEKGFSHLLMGLVMHDSEFSLDAAQGLLLGKWIALIRTLRQDLKSLTQDTKKSYSDWVLELKQLIFNYLSSQSADDDEQTDLFNHLDEFSKASSCITDQKVSFTSVKQHLESFLGSHSFVFRENHLQAVRFCSMLPMRAVPAKVIALMGMHETAFPRQDKPLSLNLMKDNSRCHYCPTRTDYDRYLFMEALLSARQYFILSYSNYDSSDGKNQGPSLLVTELFNYIQSSYKISGSLLFQHPFHVFDASYFSSDSANKNYSLADYKAALSFYSKDKKPRFRFISDFKSSSEIHFHHGKVDLDIKQLKTSLQNPLKSYFNKTLGIYLREDEEDLQTEENFTIDSLQLYHFKKNAEKQKFSHVLHEAEKRGKLPFGLFKKTAMQTITHAVQKHQDILRLMGIENIFEIHLNEQYDSPFQDSQGWKLPPFKMNYKNKYPIKITGTLNEISSQGLIAYIKGDKTDLTKAWAEFIILCCLIDHHQLPIQKKLLCSKSGKVINEYLKSPLEDLELILDNHFHSLEYLSPVISEWTHDIIHQDVEDLQTSIDKSLKDTFNPMRNSYMKWICQGQAPKAENMVEHWQTKAQQLFSSLYQSWKVKDE